MYLAVEPLISMYLALGPLTPMHLTVGPLTPMYLAVEPLTPMYLALGPLTHMHLTVGALTPMYLAVGPLTPMHLHPPRLPNDHGLAVRRGESRRRHPPVRRLDLCPAALLQSNDGTEEISDTIMEVNGHGTTN